MSADQEVERIAQAKADIKTAIERKGVTVGDGRIDTYAEKINQISGGITPTGTLNVTENGVYDVYEKEFVDVNTPVPSGSINITENGDGIDVSQYATANVNTPVPSGSINITENGDGIDVSQYATANVDVSGGGAPENVLKMPAQASTAIGANTVVGYKNTILDNFISAPLFARESSDIWKTKTYVARAKNIGGRDWYVVFHWEKGSANNNIIKMEAIRLTADGSKIDQVRNRNVSVITDSNIAEVFGLVQRPDGSYILGYATRAATSGAYDSIKFVKIEFSGSLTSLTASVTATYTPDSSLPGFSSISMQDFGATTDSVAILGYKTTTYSYGTYSIHFSGTTATADLEYTQDWFKNDYNVYGSFRLTNNRILMISTSDDQICILDGTTGEKLSTVAIPSNMGITRQLTVGKVSDQKYLLGGVYTNNSRSWYKISTLTWDADGTNLAATAVKLVEITDTASFYGSSSSISGDINRLFPTNEDSCVVVASTSVNAVSIGYGQGNCIHVYQLSGVSGDNALRIDLSTKIGGFMDCYDRNGDSGDKSHLSYFYDGENAALISARASLIGLKTPTVVQQWANGNIVAGITDENGLSGYGEIYKPTV